MKVIHMQGPRPMDWEFARTPPCGLEIWVQDANLWIWSWNLRGRRPESFLMSYLIVYNFQGGVHANFKCTAQRVKGMLKEYAQEN